MASNCLVTAGPLAFADYDASGPVDGSADISVRCSNGTPYRIKLGAGNTGTFAQRLLNVSGANQLEYNLFTDSGRGTIWGETVGTDTVPGNGRGMSILKANTHTVYGTIANSACEPGRADGHCTRTTSRSRSSTEFVP